MDRPKATPKDFFLWAGAMVSLYAGVVAFIALIFDYINYTFPDPLQYYGDPYSSVSYEMAALIVLAPVLLILMRFIRRDIATDASRGELWVRRWALFLTVFAAGATIVIDLITLITTFLSGDDLSARFLLKVLVVLLVAGAGFLHFYADIRGYWMRFPERARAVNWGVGILIVISIVAGFFIVGTPQQARQYRLDEQKVNDLTTLQWQIVSYWQQKQVLPGSLAQLSDPISGFVAPVDPQTGASYRYEKTGSLSFRLCAGFNLESRGTNGTNVTRPTEPYSKGIQENWQHGAGEKCFERTIDPELYPPVSKVK